MGLDMSDFKVIYNNRAYNVISVIPSIEPDPQNNTGVMKPHHINVWFINEDSELVMIHDEARMFKFVRR